MVRKIGVLENEYNNTQTYINIATYINEKELRVLPYSPILYSVEILDDNGTNYLYYEEFLTKDVLNRVVTAIDGGDIKKKLKSRFFKSRTAEKIKEFIRDEYKKRGIKVKYAYNADLIKALAKLKGSDKAASKVLAKAGFVGVSYPAQYRSGGRSDGKRNYVIFNEKDLKITNKIRLFRSGNGEVYGFVKNGKIYIDTSIARADTPIHEYTHLWARALRENNPREWNNIIKLLKKEEQTWEYVKQIYPELTADSDIADEVLAMYSGKRGEERLKEEINRVRADKSKSVFDRARIIRGLHNIKQALDRFWEGVADFLHIHYTTAQEVADRVLYDMLNKVNPNEYISNKSGNVHGQRQYNAEEQAIIDKGRLLAGEGITSPIRSQVNNLSGGKDTRLFSIISENSSKVVDENGENTRAERIGQISRQAEREIRREDKEQKDKTMENVMSMIGRAGIEVEVMTAKELLEKASEMDSKAVEILQSVEGVLFGFVYDGKIYI